MMSDLRHHFGVVFRRARLEQRLTLRELGERTGIKPSVIGAYERGERWAGPEALSLLVNELDLKGEDLFA